MGAIFIQTTKIITIQGIIIYKFIIWSVYDIFLIRISDYLFIYDLPKLIDPF